MQLFCKVMIKDYVDVYRSDTMKIISIDSAENPVSDSAAKCYRRARIKPKVWR